MRRVAELIHRHDYVDLVPAIDQQPRVASKVPVVVAVSCNVATFARDARLLIDGGYKMDAVVPVDQFRHTQHVELVARFVR